MEYYEKNKGKEAMEPGRKVSFGRHSFQFPVRRSKRYRAIRPGTMSFGNAWQQLSVHSATENREERDKKSQDVGGGVKMNSCFCSKGQKGEPQMGNRRFVSSGLCSVAIYPTQWSRTSTLAAEDKERKGSGWVLSALFKQRIPCGYAMCKPSTRDVRVVLHIQRWSSQSSDPCTYPQKNLNEICIRTWCLQPRFFLHEFELGRCSGLLGDWIAKYILYPVNKFIGARDTNSGHIFGVCAKV